MKKIIFILLSAFLAVTVIACSNDGKQKGITGTTSAFDTTVPETTDGRTTEGESAAETPSATTVNDITSDKSETGSAAVTTTETETTDVLATEEDTTEIMTTDTETAVPETTDNDFETNEDGSVNLPGITF